MKSLPEAPTVLYDGTCNLCLQQVKFWEKVARNVNFLALQNGLEHFPQVSYEEAMREMKLVDTKGNVYGGAEAFVKLFKYSYPLIGFLTLFYYLPGIHFIANKIYAFVAKNRYYFFGKATDCESGSCNLKSYQ